MFNLANFFTSFNLLSGVSAILFALVGRLDIAVFAIVFGAFCDFLDGFIARKMNTQGELGKQLDSLADMVTFGVAPGVIMFVILCIPNPIEITYTSSEIAALVQESVNKVIRLEKGGLLPLMGFVIPFFALFRLANFNIDTRQTSSFIGLPTPAATLFFLVFPLILSFPDYSPEFLKTFSEIVFSPFIICFVIVIVSLMMVSSLPLFSLKFKDFSWSNNTMRYVFLLISLIFIVFLRTWSIAIIVFLYLFLSLIENSIIKKKKNEI